jgi:uncharacterized membrane protein YebE (DUF533 family)
MFRNEHCVDTTPQSNRPKKDTLDAITAILSAAIGAVLLGSVVAKGAIGAIVSAIIGAGIGIAAYLSYSHKNE